MKTSIVDTNVILVANGQHEAVSPDCTRSCAVFLHEVMREGRVAVDDGFRILNEYQNKTAPQAAKRPGDVFLKWLLRNNANSARCDNVRIIEHEERGFESFPADPRLSDFDPPDRKFVAVAAQHPERPTIAQAADSKWLTWAPALLEHGVCVEFLCPVDIELFDNKKKRKGGSP